MKHNIEIKWDQRYSTTMEDDEQGRWARIAYSGNFKKGKMGFVNNRVAQWQIAWIDKIIIKDKLYFKVKYEFPSNRDYVFEDLEQAYKAVEESFIWFITMCLQK